MNKTIERLDAENARLRDIERGAKQVIEDMEGREEELRKDNERLRAAQVKALGYLNEMPPRWRDARRALEGGK